MASGWYHKAFDRIKHRSLFVKVAPTPTGLSERRGVLHLLKQHGQIEVFKRLSVSKLTVDHHVHRRPEANGDTSLLSQDPSTFICATTTPDDASKIVSTSPLHYKYITEPLEAIQARAAPGTRPTGVAAPIEIHELKKDAEGDLVDPTPELPRNNNSASEEQQQHGNLVKTFKVHVFPSGAYYDHRKALRSSPLHGRWPPQGGGGEDHHDGVYYALHRVVPDNIAARALCDWRTGGQLSEADKVARATPAVAKFVHIRDRQQRAAANRRVEEAAEDELVAWKGLWEEPKKGERRRRDEGCAEAGAGAGAKAEAEAEADAIAAGTTLGTTTTATAASSDVVSSEWQKLEAAEAAGADSGTLARLRRSPQIKRPQSMKKGPGSPTLMDKSGDDPRQLPRKVRRKAFHMDMMKTRHEMQRRSSQTPSTQSSPTQNPSGPSTPPPPSTPTF